MSNKRINKSRRALLNTTLGLGALGATLPGTWTKPIVNAVVIPAHAMTSPLPDPMPDPMPSFSVEKTQSGGANPAMIVGDAIEYTIAVTNTGDVDLTNIVATDTLPDGTVIILSGQTESLDADGVLQIGETWTYETTYEPTADDIIAGADLTNSVSVAVDELDDPEIDSVDTPVVPVVCPEVVIGDVIIGSVGSGAVICTLTFDVFSSDSTPLMVTEITNTALSTDATVTYEAFPAVVTDSIGTRVAWAGGFASPECAIPLFDISDVVFTVTATCEGAVEPITMDFALTEIAALA